jgi:two-component system, NtrC family, nitrogen regulation sensor histidine kinase NtrY
MTTKARGQGFGLAVVKRLTEALDGTITYESEIGKGTTFKITLPLTANQSSTVAGRKKPKFTRT